MLLLSMIKAELSALAYRTRPLAISNTLDIGIWVTDVIMLGYLGKGNLAAGALGYNIFNLIWIFVEGTLTAQEMLSVSFSGKTNPLEIRLWFYTSVIIVVFLSIFGTVVFAFSPFFISYIMSDNWHVGFKASQHLGLLIPTLWLTGLQRSIEIYLITQRIYSPSIIFCAIGAAVNISLNYWLMFASGLGFVGCAVSTFLSRLLMLTLFLAYTSQLSSSSNMLEELSSIWTVLRAEVRIVKDKVTRAMKSMVAGATSRVTAPISTRRSEKIGTQIDSSDAALDKDNIEIEMISPLQFQSSARTSSDIADASLSDSRSHSAALESVAPTGLESTRQFFIRFPLKVLHARTLRFLVIGAPSGVALWLDSTLLIFAAFFVAGMGSVPLAAHEVLVTLISFLHRALSQSVSSAIATRLSGLLSRRQLLAARLSSRIALASSLVLMLLTSGIVFLILYVATDFLITDADVQYRVGVLAIWVALYQLAYGLQACATGILRSVSQQAHVAVVTFFSMWIVGLPTGLYLYFVARPSFGLEGIWIGLMTGMILQAITVAVMALTLDWQLELKIHLLRRGELGDAASGPGLVSSSMPTTLTEPTTASMNEGEERGGEENDFTRAATTRHLLGLDIGAVYLPRLPWLRRGQDLEADDDVLLELLDSSSGGEGEIDQASDDCEKAERQIGSGKDDDAEESKTL